MITEAVQSKLAAILLESYSHVAPEDASAPFVVHMESAEPIRTKEGVVGYIWDVNVILVALDPATREAYTMQIVSSIEAMCGTTVLGTNITEANYVSDTPMFDEETGLYGINILFSVISSNR